MNVKVKLTETDLGFTPEMDKTTVIYDGENGATFTPSVSDDGVLSWTNNRELENPAPIKITPLKGVDYYTDEEKAEWEAYIATELAKRGQLKPEIAESEEWLKTEGNADKTKFYALPDNKIYAYMYTEKVVGGNPNLADTASEDWWQNASFSSSGGRYSGDGDITNFIPYTQNANQADVIWLENLAFVESYRFIVYKDDKSVKKVAVTSSLTKQDLDPPCVTTENGIIKIDTSRLSAVHEDLDGGAFIRLPVKIVDSTKPVHITLNGAYSEPTVVREYAWTYTGHQLTNPAVYEDEIIAVTKTANKNAVDIVGLQTANADFESRLTTLEEGEEDDEIPEYWQTHLAEKIATIKALQDEGGKDCFSFVVITDIHYESNLGKLSPTLAKRIMDECGIKYCLCLGDTQTRHGAKYDEAYIENEWVGIEKMLSPIRDRLLITQGNHDGSYYWFDKDGDNKYEPTGDDSVDVNGDGSVDSLDRNIRNFTPQRLYGHIFRKVSTIDNVHFSEDGRGYYVDDYGSKVRYILLNSHVNKWEETTKTIDGKNVTYMKYNNMDTFRYGQAQFDMVEESLSSVPSNDWAVIVASHVPLDRSGEFKAWGSDIVEVEGNNHRVQGEIDDSVLMAGVLNAYTNHDNSDKSKAKYANTSVGTQVVPQEDNFDKVVVDVDFSTAKGTLIGYFGGHTHIDHLLPKNYSWANSAISNCLTITTRCDGNEGRSGDTRTAGTTSEQSFDVFTVNKATRRIYATKIGAGSNRGGDDAPITY